MYIGHIRHMSHEIFMSMGDKTKIRMTINQLYFSINDSEDTSYLDVFAWVCENTTSPFYITKEVHKDTTKAWVYFYEETDLIGFKMKWM